jgi:hyperosmotically inducible periplasmic protein
VGRTPPAAKAAGRRVTDGWIKSKIYAQYLTENALEDSDIDVDVQSGVVTLNGTVVTDAGRTRAVAIAKATDGVRNVKDALKVAKR